MTRPKAKPQLWRAFPPTQKQRAFFDRVGVNCPPTRGAASDKIGDMLRDGDDMEGDFMIGWGDIF